LFAGVLAVFALLATFAFGPLVTAQVRAEAARRHIEMRIGGVRPGWFGVRLLGVVASPAGVQGVEAHLDEVRIALGADLRVHGVEAEGGEIVLVGPADRLADQLRAWQRGRGSPSASTARPAPWLALEGTSLRWDSDERGQAGAELSGITVHRDSKGVRLSVKSAQARSGPLVLEASGAAAELDASNILVNAHAASLVIAWSSVPAVSQASDPEAETAPDVPPLPAPAGRSKRGAPAPSAAPASPPPVVLPDLHSYRARVTALADILCQHMVEGAEVGIDALTWRFATADNRSDQTARPPLTVGPGPLSLTRSKSTAEVHYSTDSSAAGTPLAVRALLPADGADAVMTLEGGPVALSLLGIHEGAAGLVDVARATLAGRARVALAGDGSAATVDSEIGTRGLAIHNAKLASDVVRGIDLELRARGVLTAAGELRVDDFAASSGAIQLYAGGALEEQPDHLAATFRFEVPSVPCQAVLDSVPTALLPALEGTRVSGTFAARGRFAFDTRTLDDLKLDYDVRDQCRVVAVPPELARERFTQPFDYRIYLPDGSIRDQTTGPGTDNWTPLDQISPYMEVAVLTTEDAGFPKHRGFNHRSIRASVVANLKAGRFVRGASTITMQLAKNLFLSRNKTLARKLQEVVLTDYLEQTFSKEELMELYLNVVEFGPAVYGIGAAAEHYFGRTPAELNLAECLFLSSLLPAPLRYGAMRDHGEVPESWMRTIHMLMQIAHKTRLISDAELAEAENETIVFWRGAERPSPRPPVPARVRFDAIDDVDPSPVPAGFP
jgi:hypothetical protein